MLVFAAALVPACAHAQGKPPRSTDEASLDLREAPVAAAGEHAALEKEPDGTPREVTLEELLAFAERNAPALQVAGRRRGHGAAEREGAAPLLRDNPAVQLAIGPRFEGGGATDFDLALSLGQTIEIAGQRGLRLDAADRFSERLDAEVAAIRWDVRRQVILGYHLAVVARERVRIGESLVAFAEDLLRIAERRLAAGEASAIDVRIAQGDVGQARQAKILAERDLRSAQFGLCEITGWSVESPPLPRGGLEVPRPVPPLGSVLALAGERHPELRVRKAAVREARARLLLADREAWPSPTLGVSLTREGRGGVPTEDPSYIVLATLGLPLPFWQRNQGERARARADEDVARAEESTAERALRARIARAHSDLRAATERLQVFASALTPSLEDSLTLLRRGLDAGELSLIDVAVARERFLQTQRDALAAYEDYYRALVELEYLIGSELPRAPNGGRP